MPDPIPALSRCKFTDCIVCEARGICLACKGSGKSGYFLQRPPASARNCPHCGGTGFCRSCHGAGRLKVPEFEPYISIETSLSIPTSIMAAIVMCSRLRRIEIPSRILARSPQAQRGWIRWRIRTHYRDQAGKCFLFGNIVGYAWCHASDSSIRFDINGNVTATRTWVQSAGAGSITVRH